MCVSEQRPLGGHIHISVERRKTGLAVPIYPNAAWQLLSLYDFFLSPLFDADKINATTRKEHGYLVRPQWIRPTFGRGIEYRKPSSIWLTKPRLAKIVFSIIRKVTKYYFNNLFTRQSFPTDERGFPTLASYMKIGALAEGRYLLRFKPNYAMVRSIRYNWTGEDYHNNIFYDSNSISGEFRNILRKLIKSRYPIYVYGMHEQRGNVVALRNNFFGIEVPIPENLMNKINELANAEHTQIDTPLTIQDKYVVVACGFSYKFRETIAEKLASDYVHTAAELRTLIEKLIKTVICYGRNKKDTDSETS